MSSPKKYMRQPGGIRPSTITPGCADAGPCGGSPGPFPSQITASFGSHLGADCADCSGLGTVTLDQSPGDCLSYYGTVSNGCDTYSVLLSYTTTPGNPVQHWALAITAPVPSNCPSGGGVSWEQTDTAFSGTIGLVLDPGATDNCCEWPTTIYIDVPDCVAGRGKPCCCGGPTKDCLHMCVTDPCLGSAPSDVRICRTSGTHFEGANGAVSCTADYDPATGWTLCYQCIPGPGGNCYTFAPGDPGWGQNGGTISLNYNSGAGWSIQAGWGSQCGKTCDCCPNWDSNWEVNVDLGAGGWFNDPVINPPLTACDEAKGVYTCGAAEFASAVSSPCFTWGFKQTWRYPNDPAHPLSTTASTLEIRVTLYHADVGKCAWYVELYVTGGGTDVNGQGYGQTCGIFYRSASLANAAACQGAVSLTVDGPEIGRSQCLGSMPASISLGIINGN